MKCADCEYFHIVQQPLRAQGMLYDMGMARCDKHDLVVDFANYGKIDRLECVERRTDERRNPRVIIQNVDR